MIISHAFYGCSIQSMIIPQKVKTIEKYDFSHCEKFRAFEIPED